MNTNTDYTTDEQHLIQHFESQRIESASATFQNAETERQQTATKADRWDDPDFCERHATAQMAFKRWVLLMVALAFSFLLNCVLVQELVPDFAPMFSRLLHVGDGTANTLATLMMTGLLFVMLLILKDCCSVNKELAALRPGLHVAVARPIRNRIYWKMAGKIAYLFGLMYGYTWLYSYIAGGVQMEQLAAASEHALIQSTAVSLNGDLPDLSGIDTEIASSQAASFAFYYSVEWCLHALILFLGTSHWFTHGFGLALASNRRDLKAHAEASKRHTNALIRLKTLCHARTPDDGVNELRRATLATIDLSGPGARSTSIGNAHGSECRAAAIVAQHSNGSISALAGGLT
ncbi:MAG: hypothetical protein H7A55_08145 [Verrucomicrobiaceae bacterium]|nr:hypothetical protein [Verrucomicrobiaceae bacterium]